MRFRVFHTEVTIELRHVIRRRRRRRLNLAALAVVLPALLSSSCLPREQGGGTDWPKVVKVVDDCAPGIVNEILDVVSRILFKGVNVEQQLKDLALKHSTTAVACAIKYVQDDWRAPGAAQTPERMSGAARGDEFLKSVGTRVEGTMGPDSYLWPEVRSRAPDYAVVGFCPKDVEPSTTPWPWHFALASARGMRS